MASSPAGGDHRSRWMHNRAFIAILPDQFADWMLTGVFYAAVHAVEALVAFDGLTNHTSHEARNRTLRTVRRYDHIWKHYRPLYDASQTAGYDSDPGSWVPAEEVKGVWIPRYLYPLERSVLKLMGDATVLPPVASPPVPAAPPTPAAPAPPGSTAGGAGPGGGGPP